MEFPRFTPTHLPRAPAFCGLRSPWLWTRTAAAFVSQLFLTLRLGGFKTLKNTLDLSNMLTCCSCKVFFRRLSPKVLFAWLFLRWYIINKLYIDVIFICSDRVLIQKEFDPNTLEGHETLDTFAAPGAATSNKAVTQMLHQIRVSLLRVFLEFLMRFDFSMFFNVWTSSEFDFPNFYSPIKCRVCWAVVSCFRSPEAKCGRERAFHGQGQPAQYVGTFFLLPLWWAMLIMGSHMRLETLKIEDVEK